MKKEDFQQFLKFVAVGIANTAFGYLVIFSCMYAFGLTAELSNFIGFGTGLVLSYSLNRGYVFQSRKSRKSEGLMFLAAFAVAYGMNFVTLVVLIHLAKIHPAVGQLLGGGVYVCVSFALNKYFVFRDARSG